MWFRLPKASSPNVSLAWPSGRRLKPDASISEGEAWQGQPDAAFYGVDGYTPPKLRAFFKTQTPSKKVLSLHGDPHDDMAQAVLRPAECRSYPYQGLSFKSCTQCD